MPSRSIHDIARKHGTDKGTHPVRSGLVPKGYTWTYGWLLEGYRDRPLKLLEIGVRRGASLRMWVEYLPRAEIVGIDIDPACRRRVTDLGGRALVLIGNQADPLVLHAAIEILGGSVDVVIDDGSHQTADHRASFEALWPHVRGWYAIEDLQATPASVPWLRELGAEFYADGKLGLMRRRP